MGHDGLCGMSCPLIFRTGHHVPLHVPCTVYRASNALVQATRGAGFVNFSFTVALTGGGGGGSETVGGASAPIDATRAFCRWTSATTVRTWTAPRPAPRARQGRSAMARRRSWPRQITGGPEATTLIGRTRRTTTRPAFCGGAPPSAPASVPVLTVLSAHASPTALEGPPPKILWWNYLGLPALGIGCISP